MDPFWAYLLIYVGVAVEGSGVTLTAATLAGAGHLNPVAVFLCAGAGNLSGDLCWYLLGYFGRFDALMRRFPRFARFAPEVEQMKIQVAEKAPYLLFTAKLAFGVASIPILVAAGVVRIPLQRIAPAQVLGEVIWTGSMVLLGTFFGQYVTQLQRDLQIAALVTGAIVVLVITWAVRRRIKPGNRTEHEQTEEQP